MVSKKIASQVSIVIPSYNMAWCLSRAIKSCLNQSSLPAEIIIVDDCSNDDTSIVVKKLSLKHPLIKYIKLAHNSGAALAMMEGVKAARCDWVAFLDADDELTPDSLSSRLTAISLYPRPTKLGFVYGDVYVQKDSGLKLIKNKHLSGYQYPYLTKELSLCQQIVLLVRRETLLKSGYPTTILPYATDDDMIMSLAKISDITSTMQPVAIIHLHNSTTRMSNNLRQVAQGTKDLIAKYRLDIIHYHGYGRLFLWYLRLFRRYVEAEIQSEHNLVSTFILKLVYQTLQFIVLHTFDIHWL